MQIVNFLLSFFFGLLALIFLIYFIGITSALVVAELRQIEFINLILSFEHFDKVGHALLALLIVTHNHPFFSRHK